MGHITNTGTGRPVWHMLTKLPEHQRQYPLACALHVLQVLLGPDALPHLDERLRELKELYPLTPTAARVGRLAENQPGLTVKNITQIQGQLTTYEAAVDPQGDDSLGEDLLSFYSAALTACSLTEAELTSRGQTGPHVVTVEDALERFIKSAQGPTFGEHLQAVEGREFAVWYSLVRECGQDMPSFILSLLKKMESAASPDLSTLLQELKTAQGRGDWLECTKLAFQQHWLTTLQTFIKIAFLNTGHLKFLNWQPFLKNNAINPDGSDELVEAIATGPVYVAGFFSALDPRFTTEPIKRPSGEPWKTANGLYIWRQKMRPDAQPAAQCPIIHSVVIIAVQTDRRGVTWVLYVDTADPEYGSRALLMRYLDFVELVKPVFEFFGHQSQYGLTVTEHVLEGKDGPPPKPETPPMMAIILEN